jgi:hypothetical protein
MDFVFKIRERLSEDVGVVGVDWDGVGSATSVQITLDHLMWKWKGAIRSSSGSWSISIAGKIGGQYMPSLPPFAALYSPTDPLTVDQGR